MDERTPVRLTCGCQVTTTRDFLGRVVGTIVARSARCEREDHVPGHVVLMPGRDNAGPGGGMEPQPEIGASDGRVIRRQRRRSGPRGRMPSEGAPATSAVTLLRSRR